MSGDASGRIFKHLALTLISFPGFPTGFLKQYDSVIVFTGSSIRILFEEGVYLGKILDAVSDKGRLRRHRFKGLRKGKGEQACPTLDMN